MDLILYWVKYRETYKQITVVLDPGSFNFSDYHRNNHMETYHWKVRPIYIYKMNVSPHYVPRNKLDGL